MLGNFVDTSCKQQNKKCFQRKAVNHSKSKNTLVTLDVLLCVGFCYVVFISYLLSFSNGPVTIMLGQQQFNIEQSFHPNRMISNNGCLLAAGCKYYVVIQYNMQNFHQG